MLRQSADESHKTVVSTLYQAGNGIFNLFDKVLVLDDGKEIYYGPAKDAKSYFEDMGFQCAPGANVADFLTSVTVKTERTVREGFQGTVPDTADEFVTRYKQSQVYRQMLDDMAATPEDTLAREVKELKHHRGLEKNRTLGFLSRETSPYISSLGRQTLACTKRYVRGNYHQLVDWFIANMTSTDNSRYSGGTVGLTS